jgi:hypothetical protein
MFKFSLVVIAIVALVIAGPLLMIWALNTFGEFLWPAKQIPYNIQTWAAAVLLGGLFSAKFR